MKTSFDLMKNLNEGSLPKIKKIKILGENQVILKEYYQMKDNEHIIWDSEIDYYDESYMEEIKNNQYQDYLDNFEPEQEQPMSWDEWLEQTMDEAFEMYDDFETFDQVEAWANREESDLRQQYNEYIEDFKENAGMTKPLDFEQWYENWIEDDDTEWEILEDDLVNNVFPEIDKQINHNCLILSGNYGSNYPDFRPSGAGGKLFTGTDDFRNYMTGFDRVCITSTDGILGAICNDHDGTVSGQFYTAPEDLTELAQLMGYTEEESNYGTIADDLEQDLANEYLDAQQLTQFMDKLIPIKDTISSYGQTNESEGHDLSKDLLGDEANKRKSEDQKSLEAYLHLANEIKDGKNNIITLDSAKELVKNAYIKAKGYYSFEPEEIDKRIAKDIPELFGELEESNMKEVRQKSAEKGLLEPEAVNESEELIEEEKVSDKLTEVKSQGNVYMLQDNDKYIVGEDYNKEENLIENAEIYNNKEEADKDYFSRCDITRDGKEVDPTEQNLGVEEQPTEEA